MKCGFGFRLETFCLKTVHRFHCSFYRILKLRVTLCTIHDSFIASSTINIDVYSDDWTCFFLPVYCKVIFVENALTFAASVLNDSPADIALESNKDWRYQSWPGYLSQLLKDERFEYKVLMASVTSVQILPQSFLVIFQHESPLCRSYLIDAAPPPWLKSQRLTANIFNAFVFCVFLQTATKIWMNNLSVYLYARFHKLSLGPFLLLTPRCFSFKKIRKKLLISSKVYI